MAEDLFKTLTPPTAATSTKPVAPTAEEKAAADKLAAEEATKQTPPSSGSQSDGTATDEEEDDLQMPSEIDLLKERAKLMGIQFSNNIGIDALKAKIEEKRNAAETVNATSTTMPQVATQTASQAQTTTSVVNALTGNETQPVKRKSLRQHLRDEKMKLIRVRITNLDPKKKDLPGEILTVANEYLGTVRKYVPFGEVTDNGFHVPQCLYDMMKERTFVSIKTRKGPKGETIVEHQNAREFALEILPQLTVDDLAQLSASQAAAGGV